MHTNNAVLGVWTNDQTHLELKIYKVFVNNDNYIKVKATLRNKVNGIVYETKTYKLTNEFFEVNRKVSEVVYAI
jgi:deoxyhypusine synthase